MNIPYIMRQCTKCGKWLVASTVNFHRTKNGRYGLQSQCKECRNKKNEQWRLENKEKEREYCKANKEKKAKYDKQYRENNKEKIAKQRKQYREANKERIAERHKQWYENNKEKELERVKQWYEDNKKKVLEYHKQYRENNKDKIVEQQKQWREANKEKRHEYHKQYRQTPQGQVVAFNCQQRRRAKEERQGSGITKDQWLEMMKFFDFRCAYSGETLTDKTRSIDHIVPLNSNGDNMIWNCVPMTRSLNSSKNDKDMLEWYREQSFYSEARLAKIYEWQEYAYNKWGKDTQYFNTNDIQIKLI